MKTTNKEVKYKYEEAHKIALDVLEQLRPHCSRIEIAGSIRRKKAEVGDIEIVAIPKPYLVGLFEDGIASVVNRWEKVRGDLEYGKSRYTQRVLPGGIKLDLFFADEDNWGYIYAMRTGSREYSHEVLANSWVRAGYKGTDGYLVRNGSKCATREEEDLFRMIGVAYIPPEDRNL